MSLAAFKRPLRYARLLLALGACASAPLATAATGWTDWGTVTELVQGYPGTPSNEMVYFVATVTSNPAQCATPPTGFYFPVTTDAQKRMWALLLSAKMADKRVQIYTDGTCHQWGQALALGIVVE